MTETNSQAQWFSDNERNWDDRAELHMTGNYYDYQHLLEDPTAISAELAQDIERFGDLTGKEVIHLQCHVGTDTIGFARRGASRIIGLDLSEASLAHARNIAECAGADVEFVHANVYDARQAVSGTFDLVYTSIGVLCWLPDIARWAQVIASLLKPGGTFFIRDDHPMFMTIGEDISDGLRIEAPYFEQDAPMTWDDDSSYVDSPGAPRITHTTNHQWNHSLGQIVTALINAGLVIDELEETPRAAWCPWPNSWNKIPLEAGTFASIPNVCPFSLRSPHTKTDSALSQRSPLHIRRGHPVRQSSVRGDAVSEEHVVIVEVG